MYANALTFPLAVAVFLVGLAILPGMLAEDGMENNEQPLDAMELRSPQDDQIDLRYLLQNFLDNRDTRSWSPLRNSKQCIGDKCRYAWKRGFETPVSSRINSRGAPAWATSQFSNSGCSGSSCLTGWKRGFRVLPQLNDEDN